MALYEKLDKKENIYPIIINQSSLVPDAYNNRFIYQFPQGSVTFNDTKVALGSISIYYSWFNITAAYGNNTFSFTFTENAGTTTYNVTIPDGFYSVSDLNSYLQQYCIQQGLYLVNGSGDYVYYLELVENSTYYSVQLNCFAFPTALPAGWTNPAGMTFPAVASTPQLIVPPTATSEFGLLIGFAPGTYPAAIQATDYSVIGTITPQLSPVQSLILSCSLLNNKYSNPSTILYSFSAAGTQFGSLIDSSPNQYSFVNVQNGQYPSFAIEILDNNFQKVKLQDPNLIITLLFKGA